MYRYIDHTHKGALTYTLSMHILIHTLYIERNGHVHIQAQTPIHTLMRIDTQMVLTLASILSRMCKLSKPKKDQEILSCYADQNKSFFR